MDVHLPNTCVYWPPLAVAADGSETNAYGRVLFSPPQELDCRWEDSSETFVNDAGEQETSAGKVFFDAENTPAFLGVLKKGTFADLVNLSDPFANAGAWEVRHAANVPDTEGVYELTTVYVGARSGRGNR